MPADAARVAAIFDLDKTLIATSSATAFATPLRHGGLLTRRAMLRAAYAKAAYLLGSADARQTERLRAALSSMIRGWDVERVRAVVAETLTAAIEPAVFAEAIALLERHREQGHVLVVASASGEDVVRPIADLLGIDHVVATRMRVLDGHYTGDLEFYAYGQGKADAVRELAEREGWDLAASHAYTDSITDLPLLEAVGHPAVVNPDRALRTLAAERGWEALTFVRPTPIALPLPPARPTAAVAGSLVVLGVAWWLLRRCLRARAA